MTQPSFVANADDIKEICRVSILEKQQPPRETSFGLSGNLIVVPDEVSDDGGVGAPPASNPGKSARTQAEEAPKAK